MLCNETGQREASIVLVDKWADGSLTQRQNDFFGVWAAFWSWQLGE